MQHGGQALRQFGGRWHLIRDARVRIFVLARTMRWASVGGVVRKAAAISSVVRPQISRKVSATRASGARAGWQQVKIKRRRSSSKLSSSRLAVVLDWASSCSAIFSWDASKRGAAAQGVDGLVTRGGDQPRARIGGHAVPRPAVERDGEGVLPGIFREIEIAEQPDERGQNPARLRAVNGVEHLANLLWRVFGHRSDTSKLWRFQQPRNGQARLRPGITRRNAEGAETSERDEAHARLDGKFGGPGWRTGGGPGHSRRSPAPPRVAHPQPMSRWPRSQCGDAGESAGESRHGRFSWRPRGFRKGFRQRVVASTLAKKFP